MKRKIKRLTAIVLSAVMLFAAIPISGFAADERKVINSGFCGINGGENLTWALYDDGELVISGEGEMDRYYVDYYDKDTREEKFPPWYNYYNQIDIITLEEGVTSIGKHAFTGDNIGYYKVNLPKSLVYYEGHPFRVNHRNCKIGQYCVLSYAGSESEWALVQQKGSSEAFNDIVYRYGKRHFVIKFNSEDMEPAIDLVAIGLDRMVFREKGEQKSISAFYYAGDHKDAKIRWSVSGDSLSYTPNVNEASGLETSISLAAEKYGEAEIKAELVDADGTVLASDSATVRIHIPQGMNIFEKTKYYATNAFMYMGGYGLWFSFAFGLFLEFALMAPVALVKMIFG